MIKKLIFFVFLMAGGFGVMHFVIGWENFATISDGESDNSPIKDTERSGGGFVVQEMDGNQADAVRVYSEGPMRIPRTRPFRLPNGRIRHVTTYVLNTEDSRPHPSADDQMELTGVVVNFYDIDGSDPSSPRAVRAGKLEAATAILQVGRDEKGRPSVREDRDMDLEQVVVTSAEGSKLGDVRMTVPRVLVRHTDQGLSLRTPTPDIEFHVTLGGDDPMDLTGQGLRAVLPSDDMPDDAPRTLEFHVTSNPVFKRGASTLRARGSLDYVEDMAIGIGHVDLREDVRADGLLSDDPDQPVTAYGDTILGSISRNESRVRGKTKRTTSWLTLRLDGQPARLEGNGAELRCARLEGWPSIAGEPAVFTASGEPYLLQSDPEAEFRAERIHVVSVPKWIGALHRPYGFSTTGFGRIAHEYLIFEGAAEVADSRSETTIRASRGIRVLRGSGDDAATVSVGQGDVTIERSGLDATGNRGFFLTGQGKDGDQSLRLGPRELDPEHAFEIVRKGDKPFTVRGHGTCNVSQLEGGRNRVELGSAADDIHAEFEDADLTDVGKLVATISEAQEIEAIEAFGAACRIERETQDGKIIGIAESIHSDDGRSFRLRGHPARIERPGDDSVVTGDEIRVIHYGGDKYAVVVDRGPSRPAHVTIVPPPESDSESDPKNRTDELPREPVDLDADRVRFVPYTLPESVLRMHTGGRLRTWDVAFAASLRADRVLADGAIEVSQRGERPFEAWGERFVTRLDGTSGILLGDPARVEHDTDDGRHVTAIADGIRVGQGSGKDQNLLLLQTDHRDPVIIVRGTEGSAGVRNLRVSCDGQIRAVGGEIEFQGPVVVRELDENGKRLKGGLHVTSASMRLETDDRGELRKLIAVGDARLKVRGVRARGDELEVDMRESRATISRHKYLAIVYLPGGRLVRGRRLEVNYVDMLVTGWNTYIEGS